MSADVIAVDGGESSVIQPDNMRNADMTAEELDKLRAELRLRQKAAMVVQFCICLLLMLYFCVRFTDIVVLDKYINKSAYTRAYNLKQQLVGSECVTVRISMQDYHFLPGLGMLIDY